MASYIVLGPGYAYRGVDNNRPPLRGVRLFLLKAGDSENLGVRLVFSKNLPNLGVRLFSSAAQKYRLHS